MVVRGLLPWEHTAFRRISSNQWRIDGESAAGEYPFRRRGRAEVFLGLLVGRVEMGFSGWVLRWGVLGWVKMGSVGLRVGAGRVH